VQSLCGLAEANQGSVSVNFDLAQPDFRLGWKLNSLLILSEGSVGKLDQCQAVTWDSYLLPIVGRYDYSV
jgi:hypothetical protein